MSNPLLQIEDLWKSYPSGDGVIEVIRGAGLSLEPGTILAVTGESGSGKSTFLHLVGAMERPDSGRIEFDGREIQSLKPLDLAAFRNRSVGFVFQFHHLLPEFSALENVMFPLLLRGESKKSADRAARTLLGEVGLAARLSHQPGELSGGEQQRVAIARALVGQPRLLLADEPTGNLDARTSDSIHRLLVEIHERYALTSIIVTHHPGLAALCSRRCRMMEGRLVPEA